MAADAAPGTKGGAAAVFWDRLSRSRLVCALALSAHRAVGLASGVTGQYGRELSAHEECSLSPVPGVGAADRHAVGGDRHGVSGAAPSAQLYAAGAVGRGLERSVVVTHGSRAEG